MGDDGRSGGAQRGLMLAALGIVFGDIGTSPLYVLHTVFEPESGHAPPVDQASVFGVVSAIFWITTLIVTVLYVEFLTRADNDGEGGLLALVALLRPRDMTGRALAVFFSLAVFGAALFFGDGMITPAISVLSAMEGMEVIDPGLKDFVVPGAVVILAILFLVQRHGTGRIGKLFGPVMAVWFTAVAVCALPEIFQTPEILKAISPHWAVAYFIDNPKTAFLSLTGIVLAVTGAEALYADIGHFGRKPISRAWLVVVFPALVVGYFGQGALVLRDSSAVSNPFFLMVPDWALVPMVVLATAATVIASQAVISGTFSVAHQAARLGYLPRLRVVHTSATEVGQLYLPAVNAVLAVSVIGLVLAFESSERLSGAYGLAVSGTIFISATLYAVLRWQRHEVSRWVVVAVSIPFLVLIGALVAANTTKIPYGGWLPLAVAAVFFVLLTTWHRGRILTTTAREGAAGSLEEFLAHIHADDSSVRRVPGCGVFLHRGEASMPLALRANLKHNHCLHESTVLLRLVTAVTPRVPPDQRVEITEVDSANGVSAITATFGYLDRVDLDRVLATALAQGLPADPADVAAASYFVSKPELHITDAPGLAGWRKRIYVAMEQLAPDPVEALKLPRERAVVLGAEIDL